MLALSTYLGHSKVADTYWYLEATPDLMRNIADSLPKLLRWWPAMTLLAPHIAAFLQQRLPIERRASPNTCDSYAHAFKLLFEYASDASNSPPRSCNWNNWMLRCRELPEPSGNQSWQSRWFQKHPARSHQVFHALHGISRAVGAGADPTDPGHPAKKDGYSACQASDRSGDAIDPGCP